MLIGFRRRSVLWSGEIFPSVRLSCAQRLHSAEMMRLCSPVHQKAIQIEKPISLHWKMCFVGWKMYATGHKTHQWDSWRCRQIIRHRIACICITWCVHVYVHRYVNFEENRSTCRGPMCGMLFVPLENQLSSRVCSKKSTCTQNASWRIFRSLRMYSLCLSLIGLLITAHLRHTALINDDKPMSYLVRLFCKKQIKV